MSNNILLIKAGKISELREIYIDPNFDISKIDDDSKAIIEADNVVMMKMFIDLFRLADNSNNITALLVHSTLSFKDNVEILKLLLSYGVDVNINVQYDRELDEKGDAVIYAILAIMCKFDKINCVKLLLEYGADPNINNGQAICCACERTNYELVKLLIIYNASVTINDLPIVFAVTSGNLKIIDLLIEHGADINAVNNFCSTNKMIAEDSKKMRKKYNKFIELGIDPLTTFLCYC